MQKISILLFTILLCCCNSRSKKADKEFEPEKINLKNEKLSLVDYNLIIGKPTFDGVRIETLNIGDINLSSGKIIACDPLVYNDTVPFAKKVKPGKYPIKIYIAKTKESGDRYALAQIELSKNKATHWILATKEKEKIKDLKEDDAFYGFGVDSGLGGFYDYETALVYEKFQKEFLKKDPFKNLYDDFFAAEFKKNAVDKSDPEDIGNWINYTFPGTDLNITMFQSGYGDGVYPAYWGIDDDGKITSLVIDFFVLELPETK